MLVFAVTAVKFQTVVPLLYLLELIISYIYYLWYDAQKGPYHEHSTLIRFVETHLVVDMTSGRLTARNGGSWTSMSGSKSHAMLLKPDIPVHEPAMPPWHCSLSKQYGMLCPTASFLFQEHYNLTTWGTILRSSTSTWWSWENNLKPKGKVFVWSCFRNAWYCFNCKWPVRAGSNTTKGRMLLLEVWDSSNSRNTETYFNSNKLSQMGIFVQSVVLRRNWISAWWHHHHHHHHYHHHHHDYY